MRKYKAALVLIVLVLLAGLGAKQYSTITMGDNEWIGLASDAGRIVFDDQATDEVNIMDARVGVGTMGPTAPVEIYTPTSDNTETLLKLSHRSGTLRVGSVIELGSTQATGMHVKLIGYAHPHSTWNTQFEVQTSNADGVWHTGLFQDEIGRVGIKNITPSYDLDVYGNARVTGVVLADGRVQAGDAASDVDARTDMPFVAAGDGQGGYFFYNANVSADTDLTGLYSTEANVERQVRVEWLVYDVTAATRHSGETVLGYTGGIESVVIADEGANDLLFKVARGAPPNLVGYLCLDVVGNHSYEVVLMTMWH